MSKQKPLYGLWYQTDDAMGWYLDYFGQPVFSEDVRLVAAQKVALSNDGFYSYSVRKVGDDGHPISE